MKSNLKLVWSDIKEDWHDATLCEFFHWQYIKILDGLRQGIWPWTVPDAS